MSAAASRQSSARLDEVRLAPYTRAAIQMVVAIPAAQVIVVAVAGQGVVKVGADQGQL